MNSSPQVYLKACELLRWLRSGLYSVKYSSNFFRVHQTVLSCPWSAKWKTIECVPIATKIESDVFPYHAEAWASMKGTVIAVMFVIEINLIASRRKNKLNIAHMLHILALESWQGNRISKHLMWFLVRAYISVTLQLERWLPLWMHPLLFVSSMPAVSSSL